MDEVFKYELKHGDNDLVINSPAIPLSVKVQNNKPYLYVLRNENFASIHLYVKVIMTGEKIDATKYKFIGSAMLDGGTFVLHVFATHHYEEAR